MKDKQQALSAFYANPIQLFIIDGLGALLSAFLLGIVLVHFESFFGIPKSALYILATLPCFFAIYDFYCYYRVKNKIGVYLKIIAIINLTYCVISLSFAFYHAQEITIFGWAYILGEIAIVAALALIEFKVGNTI